MKFCEFLFPFFFVFVMPRGPSVKPPKTDTYRRNENFLGSFRMNNYLAKIFGFGGRKEVRTPDQQLR